jgi:acyl-CoA hydrolase/RimJ/RimL family protein N-acetyltransferase
MAQRQWERFVLSAPPTTTWRDRLMSATDAAALVEPGDHVFLGTACATPRALAHALEERYPSPPGVQLVHFLTNGAIPFRNDAPATKYLHKVFFVGSDTRDLLGQGKIDYIPISLSHVHSLIESRRIRIDKAFVQVAPPDEHGLCNLGVSVDLIPSVIRNGCTIIAEVNPNMPRTHGATTIPAADIDVFVPVDTPVIEYLHEPVDAVAEQIARYVARVIDDGSTLQIGLGRIPNEMLRYLTNRRDLGIHSDVITEAVVDLVEQGVVTGNQKTASPGKIVTSYCMGTRRLYDLVDGNPMFEFRPIDEVCDPATIAANSKMVSVTQAFAIDLTGQVCADQFGGEFYSGVSTQPDFMRGAAASEGGKAIVCLASTTEDGSESRIRSLLAAGEGVTIARSDVHFVVTEYGIAYLFGKSISERAMALIEIAHPDFRDELLAEAKRLCHVGEKRVLKSRSAYPIDAERTVRLKNGKSVLLRPTRSTDAQAMQALFYALRPEDVYTRFFTNLRSLTDSMAQHLSAVSYEDEMAFLAVTGSDERETVIGTAGYYVDPSNNTADVAYMIHPDWQGQGLGTALQDRIIEYARDRGLRGFTADVLPENKKMIKVFERSGCEVSYKLVDGSYEVLMLFSPA